MPRNFVAAAAAVALGLFTAASAAAAAPVVHAPAGALSGTQKGAVEAFLGVPFAAPPVGQNRWRPPQPLAPWQGVRAADHFGSACYQGIVTSLGQFTHEYLQLNVPVSEDCLYLNVWRPAHAKGRLPVMVWVHGGGFGIGSGSVPIYDGAKLAAQGVIVVSVNYRVGVLGFLAHPELSAENGGSSGNYGLEDVVAGLRWVRDNIAAFGGDPGAVTIAGQSAGSAIVHDLVTSHEARGLFQRAIGESFLPSMFPPHALADSEKDGVAFAKSKGAADIAALRALTPEQLTAGPPQPLGRFFPIVDGKVLAKPPMQAYAEGDIADVPMIVGMNAGEGDTLSQSKGPVDAAAIHAVLERNYGASADKIAAFYPVATQAERDASAKLIGRESGLASLWTWDRARATHGKAPVYGYLWSHVEPGPESARYGAFHSSEIPYVFQTLDAAPERNFTAQDRAVSAQISAYWVSFVRTGDPNGGGRPAWPRLTVEAPKILEIDDPTHARPLLAADKLQAVKAAAAAGARPSIF